jgi:CDP-diacylglycerol---glycerol-3-phosphate 3-phosphatidyltransferase
MASIYDLKPRFQYLLRPLLARSARLGITPNAITWLALLGSSGVGCIVWLASNHRFCLLLLPAWLLARMALNALDGMMATCWNRISHALRDMALTQLDRR